MQIEQKNYQPTVYQKQTSEDTQESREKGLRSLFKGFRVIY